MDCVVGEGGVVVGVAEGIGGAGDLNDLGLGVSGFGPDGFSDICGLWFPKQDCGLAERSTGGIQGGGRSVWSPEHLLSSKMVNS